MADLSLRESLERVVSAYTHASLQPSMGEGRVDPSGLFSSRYLIALARELTVDDIAALLHAESLREKGLGLARCGKHDEARELLFMARQTLELPEVAEQARLAGNTFQAAAEAYLFYRISDYAGARKKMLESLLAARILAARHGYDMEFRRIHLARNLVRVLTVSGARERGLEGLVGLLAYIDSGRADDWPICDVSPWPPQRELSREERGWCCDELLRDIESADVHLGGFVEEVSALVCATEPRSAEGESVRQWCSLMVAAKAADSIALVSAGPKFFASGRGAMPYAWESAARAIAVLCEAGAPDLVPVLRPTDGHSGV